jgi:hypothetical protein
VTITYTTTRQAGASKPTFRLAGQGTMQRPNTTIDNKKRIVAIKTYELITNYPILYKAGPGAVFDILIKSNVVNKNDDDMIDIIIQAFKKYKSENNYKQANITFDTTNVGRRLIQGENIMKITKGALKKVIREEIENLNELFESGDDKTKPGLEISDEQQLDAIQSKTAAKMAGSEDNPMKYMKMSSLLADKPASERGEGLAIWAMDLANNDVKLAYRLLDKAKMELTQFKKQV